MSDLTHVRPPDPADKSSADAVPHDEPWPLAVKVVLGLAVFSLVSGFVLATVTFFTDTLWDHRGTVGDFYGGHLAGFGNLATFFIVFAALLMQTRELGLQRVALKLQRDEMIDQREELEAQTAQLKRTAEQQERAAVALERAAVAQQAAADAQARQAEIASRGHDHAIEQAKVAQRTAELQGELVTSQRDLVAAQQDTATSMRDAASSQYQAARAQEAVSLATQRQTDCNMITAFRAELTTLLRDFEADLFRWESVARAIDAKEFLPRISAFRAEHVQRVMGWIETAAMWLKTIDEGGSAEREGLSNARVALIVVRTEFYALRDACRPLEMQERSLRRTGRL